MCVPVSLFKDIMQTTVLPYSRYDAVGRAWSLFPPDDDRDGLNYTRGIRRISAGILAVCLIQQGEDPIHPDYGMAPELFEPLTNYAPQFWVYNAEKTILRWVPGIAELAVDVTRHNPSENQLRTQIRFIPKLEADVNVLTWDYYAYQGAIWDKDFSTFLNDVHLNNQPFAGFTNA